MLCLVFYRSVPVTTFLTSSITHIQYQRTTQYHTHMHCVISLAVDDS